MQDEGAGRARWAVADLDAVTESEHASVPVTGRHHDPLSGIAAAGPASAAYRHVLDPVAARAQEDLAASSVSVWLWVDPLGATPRLVTAAGDAGVATGDVSEGLAGTTGPSPDRPVGRAYLGQAGPPGPGSLPDTGHGDVLGAPVILDGGIWGEILCRRDPGERPFEAADLARVQVVADQAGAAVEPLARLKAMADLAFTDSLTGLPNRRAVDDVLAAAIERHVIGGVDVSLIIADVNGLKRINDENGHDAGDRALAHFAAILNDAAGLAPGAMPGRLGGDEFCVILEGHDADVAAAVAQEICQRAAAGHIGDGAACGIASTSEPIGDVSSPGRLFALADAAQSLAKRSSIRHPVVAGRDLSTEAAANLGARPGTGPPRRRRSRRGGEQRARAERALDSALHALDSSGARDPLERLEVVAESVCRLIDGCSWWVSGTDDACTWLRTLSRSVLRKTNGHVDPELTGERSGSYLLADWPATVAVLAGRSTVIMADDPTADPNELEMLSEVGYTAVLMAGATDADGRGWLVEIYVDAVSLSPAPLAGTLRALVACALTPPPPPTTSP